MKECSAFDLFAALRRCEKALSTHDYGSAHDQQIIARERHEFSRIFRSDFGRSCRGDYNVCSHPRSKMGFGVLRRRVFVMALACRLALGGA